MNELPLLMASFTAGALLGLAFFWGLWVTLNGIERAHRPALRMLGSLLLRFSLALAGFYLLAYYAGWQHLLTAAIGFTLSRLVIIRRMRSRHTKQASEA